VGKNCRIYHFTEKLFQQDCEFQTVFDDDKFAEQRVALFSPDGKQLITGGTDGLTWWSPADDFISFTQVKKIDIYNKSVKDLHWYSDSSHFVVIGKMDGKVIKLEDKSNCEEIFSIKPRTAQHEFRVCRFAPTGGHFFTSQNINRKEASVTKWGLHTKKEIMTKQIIRGYHHTAFDISSCGRYLALGSVNGDIVVVSSADLSKIMFLAVHSFCVSDVTFFSDHSDKKKISVVSCGLEGAVIITPLKPNVTSPKQLVMIITVFVLLLAILYQFFHKEFL